MKNQRVIIVDNNVVFREDFKSILENEFSATVIATLDNDKDLLNLNNVVSADLIFINLAVARVTGFQTIKQFIWKIPTMKVIGINSYFSEQIYLIQLIEIGFKGCIDSNNIYSELNEVFDKVTNGRLFFSNTISMTTNSKKP